MIIREWELPEYRESFYVSSSPLPVPQSSREETLLYVVNSLMKVIDATEKELEASRRWRNKNIAMGLRLALIGARKHLILGHVRKDEYFN